MLRQLKNDERGVIFVTVLMIIIVMMVLTVSVISMNVSQVMITESEIRRVQAEILAMGALSVMTANHMLNPATSNSIQLTETIGNTVYDISGNIMNCPTCPGATNSLVVNVTIQ